mgnify:CR=1 FL=1
MSVTFVKQKIGQQYCTVACIASVLLDRNDPTLFNKIGFDIKINTYDDLQEIIIDKFPRQLQRPNAPRGIPDHKDIPLLLCQLGIELKDPRYIEGDWEDAMSFLLQHKGLAERIFLLTEKGTHCIRISKIETEGIEVMNPRNEYLTPMNWDEFKFYYTARSIY